MKSSRSLLLSAAAAGLFCGWAAWGGNEVQPAVFFVFGYGAVFGFLNPKLAPTTAVLIGAGVPGFYFVSGAMGHPARYPPEPSAWASLIAIVPALVGSGIGAVLRWGLHPFKSR